MQLKTKHVLIPVCQEVYGLAGALVVWCTCCSAAHIWRRLPELKKRCQHPDCCICILSTTMLCFCAYLTLKVTTYELLHASLHAISHVYLLVEM